MMGWGYGMMGWGWLMMIGAVLLTVLGVIALICYIQLSGRSNNRPTGNTALDILSERYAKGEISEAEYRRMKEDIQS